MSKDYNSWRTDPREPVPAGTWKDGEPRTLPRPLMHTHSKWETCNARCLVFWKRNEVWDGKQEAHYPDSVKRDIVIYGVAFKASD